jgi:nitronate monooxygenase
VSQTGQLGVISGTAVDVTFARRLQLGDADGCLRRAAGHFPDQVSAQRVLKRYWIPGGKKPDATFAPVPMFTFPLSTENTELAVVATFVEVFLAKEGHTGKIGINFLEKIQLPILPSLYGALLAGIDYVLMGAGIPREIPGVLDRLSRHEDVSVRLHVDGADSHDDYRLEFSPRAFLHEPLPQLVRPQFLPIVASYTLALTLAKKANGPVDGFVVEGPTAGGHNAPPRGEPRLNERGEPIYGEKDVVDLGKLRELGLPFWLAGSFGHGRKLREALAQGAAGVQVGTAFAFCEESGIEPELKAAVLETVRQGKAEVFTDPRASASGFPFKVARQDGTLSEPSVLEVRERLCDLGFLRHLYKRPDGSLGARCPAEPEHLYERKGGAPEDTCGRKCLCNGLMATIGLAQRRADGYVEPPLVTAGDDLATLGRFFKDGRVSYSAKDVIASLLEDLAGTDENIQSKEGR